MENVKRINQYLKDTYGEVVKGRPKFRLIWSDSLTEVRKSIFGASSETEEIREVPKYSFLSERWVLEVDTQAYPGIFRAALRHKSDVVKRGDGYEPLRVFQTRTREYLKPDLEVCKILCDGWVELVNRPEARRLTEKQASAQDAIKMREETQKFFELLSADDSDLIHKFRDKEAVLIHRDEVI